LLFDIGVTDVWEVFRAPHFTDLRLAFGHRKSVKNVSGHRYFLQYPPNGDGFLKAQMLANNVLFRYPPPPPPPPPRPPFAGRTLKAGGTSSSP
jgi:hypothetical protein